jgi:hypothetical protein
MSPISWSVTYNMDGEPCMDKCYSFLGPFISYKENEILRKQFEESYSKISFSP